MWGYSSSSRLAETGKEGESFFSPSNHKPLFPKTCIPFRIEGGNYYLLTVRAAIMNPDLQTPGTVLHLAGDSSLGQAQKKSNAIQNPLLPFMCLRKVYILSARHT